MKIKVITASFIAACFFSVATAHEGHDHGDSKPAVVEAAKADFKQVMPGVKKKVLWEDAASGAYGTFTKFDPGQINSMHSHTHEIRIVVLQGAYLYKAKNGPEKRIGPGSFIAIPGGDVHESGADAKEGALFYEESPGKFDLKPAEPSDKK
ncbi:MAG TPA: DUF4437 domain-containing protein [Nevskiaceae bacterium]|nr:DUF4437 domain-containing protein [Nevskiaceae bacterium]